MPSIDRVALRGALGMAAMVPLSTPAMASEARLVSCAPVDCLQLSGRRADAATPVLINDHVVAVQGNKRWRVRLPVATIRAWSTPHARSVRVTMPDPSGGEPIAEEAVLPIGLLGPRIDLAALIVRVR